MHDCTRPLFLPSQSKSSGTMLALSTSFLLPNSGIRLASALETNVGTLVHPIIMTKMSNMEECGATISIGASFVVAGRPRTCIHWKPKPNKKILLILLPTELIRNLQMGKKQ